nr:hypothetical protein [Tanacetum cinerariifolium]
SEVIGSPIRIYAKKELEMMIAELDRSNEMVPKYLTKASGIEPTQEKQSKEPKDASEEELKKIMELLLVEELYIEGLQVKYLIIGWEIYSKGQRKYWKLIRVGNHTEVYQRFDDMLKKFDREDLDKLWSLVKESCSTTEVNDEKAKEFWVELKRLYEPDSRYPLWALQRGGLLGIKCSKVFPLLSMIIPTVSINVPTADVYITKKFATVEDFALLHEDKIYSESKTRICYI